MANDLVLYKSQELVRSLFYCFDQNNSGGYYEHNRCVSEFVIIEAFSAEKANEKAIELGIYFDGCVIGEDCPCCGDRWYPTDDIDGTPEPEVFGKNPDDVESYFCPSNIRPVFIYYLNGTLAMTGTGYAKPLNRIE